MPRQQKRAAKRAADKAQNAKVKAAKKPQKPPENDPANPLILSIDDLDKKQLAGVALYERLKKEPTMRIAIGETQRMYRSRDDEFAYYFMERNERNVRGNFGLVYACKCHDSKIHARRDCLHRFCEKMIDRVVIVEGELTEEHLKVIEAVRRPTRRRKTHDGRDIRTSQRQARVDMPVEIPRLVLSLKNAWEAKNPNAMALKHNRLTADGVRAAALVLKVCEGKSADAMVSRYQQLIEDHGFGLSRPPHQNSLSIWMNDESLTPILMDMLDRTARPFRAREVAAIADSTKISQLRTAHARLVDYGKDKRPTATWVKAHALIGVETLVVMALAFSEKDRNDNQFTLGLVDHAVNNLFNIGFLLADKMYLGENYLGELWKRGIKACIPVKSKWDLETKTIYFEASKHLAEWYDKRPRSFDEMYRLRPKIEGLFSLVKRLAQNYCWSRGRARKDADGKVHYDEAVDKVSGPCTAWKNETICKFIYTNLRATCLLQDETGVKIDYLVESRFFPPPDKPLITGDI